MFEVNRRIRSPFQCVPCFGPSSASRSPECLEPNLDDHFVPDFYYTGILLIVPLLMLPAWSRKSHLDRLTEDHLRIPQVKKRESVLQVHLLSTNSLSRNLALARYALPPPLPRHAGCFNFTRRPLIAGHSRRQDPRKSRQGKYNPPPGNQTKPKPLLRFPCSRSQKARVSVIHISKRAFAKRSCRFRFDSIS